MDQLGIIIGLNFYSEADATRITQSERSFTEKAKIARRDTISARKDEENDNIQLKGQLYGAGIAD